MTSGSDLDLNDLDPAGQSYVRRLLAHAGHIRLPELFSNPRPDAAYHLQNRHGVDVIALRTTDLAKPQLMRIREFRLAQYLSAGLVNPAFVYLKGLRHEPLSSVAADDIHIIAAVPTTGELLSYLVLRTPMSPSTALMRTKFRPLLPVEQAFGRDVYSRLAILPDLLAARVIELSRFVKNHQFSAHDERIVRAPVEVTVALHHILDKLPIQTNGWWSALLKNESPSATSTFSSFPSPSFLRRLLSSPTTVLWVGHVGPENFYRLPSWSPTSCDNGSG